MFLGKKGRKKLSEFYAICSSQLSELKKDTGTIFPHKVRQGCDLASCYQSFRHKV